MLVLTRKKNESVIVDNSIEVFVVEINNEQVKLGFRAPKNIQILRSEIHTKVIAEMEKAANSDPKILNNFKKKVLEEYKPKTKQKISQLPKNDTKK